MSTIRVDNFGPSAGGTTYSARGIAKAWVNFDGTGTIAARDSENVSSLTDNGTGNYTVNLSNAFGAAEYAPVALCQYDQSGSANFSNVLPDINRAAGAVSTGSLNVRAGGGGSSTLLDVVAFMVSAHGDLA